MPVIDRSYPLYWGKVKPGDILTLRVKRIFERLMGVGGADSTRRIDLAVNAVTVIEEQQKASEWLVCELGKVTLSQKTVVSYLVVKVAGDDFDLKVMWVPDGFTPGGRGDVIDSGGRWVFQTPKDESNYKPRELRYATEIEQTAEDGTPLVYRQKAQGVLFGTATHRPPTGSGPVSAGVVEYRADRPTENPELMLAEIGGATLPGRHGGEQPFSEWPGRVSPGPGGVIPADFGSWKPGKPAADGGVLLLLRGASVTPADVELTPS